jgi:hypothetical protein
MWCGRVVGMSTDEQLYIHSVGRVWKHLGGLCG